MSHLMRATLYAYGNVHEFHLFRVPELGEKFCYRHTTSLDAFKKAQAKILNKHLETEDSPPPALRAFVQFDKDYALTTKQTNPKAKVFTHADIYAFYKAIGWSYVRKRFW